MKISKILQFVWFATGVLAILIALYNYTRFHQLTQKVYMPIIIAIFCFILFFKLYRKENK